MTFTQILLLVAVVLIIQAGVLFALMVIGSAFMRREKVRMQDAQLDALYAKLVKLVIKFKRELPDYREISK